MLTNIHVKSVLALSPNTSGLGFNIRGGTDNFHVLTDPGIFITTVKANGAAAKDGRLQAGDKILEVSGMIARRLSASLEMSCLVLEGVQMVSSGLQSTLPQLL